MVGGIGHKILKKNDGTRNSQFGCPVTFVNYLVHLEGMAALVNDGVLRLSAIDDLMAYRYFIAVNNPVVQKFELIPYQDYYQGLIKLFPKWAAKNKKRMPMAKTRLDKKLKPRKKTLGFTWR